MKIRILLSYIILSAILLLSSCGFVPESTFELSNESRLPKWYFLSPGSLRSDIKVKMNYFVNSTGRTATFIITDTRTNKSVKYEGSQRGLEPIKLRWSRESHPMYEVITVNGITEVIEHRKMEPIFYITDNPAILNELGLTGANQSPN